MRPRVLFVNRVFPPARGATGTLLAELADALAGRGWAVTVVTGRPAGTEAHETRPSGVQVERVGRLGDGWTGLARRAAGFAALYPALVAGALRGPRPDVLVTLTDPPLLAVLGAVVARRRGVPAVHWVQDLYPEVAIELGVVRRGPLARRLGAASAWALARHARVVSIGACMTRRLIARGVEPARIVEVPNWAPAGVVPVEHAANALRPRLAPPSAVPGGEAFLVMYAGTMGLTHPFDALLDAAALLHHEAPDVRWAFVGDGARRPWLEAEVARRRLDTVSFAPLQPAERLAESLSAADLHVVSMEPGLCGLVVPSKVYGGAAAGRPTVFLGPPASEAARFLDGARAGTVLGAPTGRAVADAVLAWRADPAGREATGTRAAAAAAASRPAAFAAFETLLRETAGRPPQKDSRPAPPAQPRAA